MGSTSGPKFGSKCWVQIWAQHSTNLGPNPPNLSIWESHMGISIWDSHTGIPLSSWWLHGPKLWAHGQSHIIILEIPIWDSQTGVFGFWSPNNLISLKRCGVRLRLCWVPKRIPNLAEASWCPPSSPPQMNPILGKTLRFRPWFLVQK